MKISCVISEFNPFHNGHKYLIDTQRRSGATHIVAVMSGSFVQRGECAALSKRLRAEVALKNGVDLVLELSSPWAVSAASSFARGGVYIASALGVCDTLFFGSECGDVSLLIRCAETILSSKFAPVFKEKFSGASSYAAAVQSAVGEIAGDDCAEALSSANNILAVEYIKELISQGSSITPETISRRAVAHDSSVTSEGFASASFIRGELDAQGYKPYVPENAVDLIEKAISSGERADFSRLDKTILYRLRTMSLKELADIPEVAEGLEYSLMRAVGNCTGVDEVLKSTVCRRYSLPRIKRVFSCALLGIDRKLQRSNPGYIRVLGLNSRGGEILRMAKKRCTLPIITKPASYKKQLEKSAFAAFEKDVLATDIRTLACKSGKMGSDFLDFPVVAD